MEILAITFRGPFAFCIREKCVDVYAAVCENHHAGVFTILNEHPLCGRHRLGGEYVYVLDGAITDHDTTDYKDDENTAVILDAEQDSEVDVSQASFSVRLPRPFRVDPISPANTEVVKYDVRGHLRNYATGLRLLYACDFSKPIFLKMPCLKSRERSADLSLNFGDFPSVTKYADIDFRYVGPESDDSDHLDAISCFDNTMKMFGLAWWLNYDTYGTNSTRTRTGSDCKSAVVISGR